MREYVIRAKVNLFTRLPFVSDDNYYQTRDNEAREKDGGTMRERTFDKNNRSYVDFVASQ